MDYIKNYGISIFLFIAMMVIFLLILSLIFAYTNINDLYIESGIFLSMALCAFLSSFFLCRKIKKNGIIHGIIINVICVAILYMISCSLNGEFIITNTLGIYIAICTLTGIVGGILGVNV